MRKALIAALVATSFLVSACNTVRGAGEDVESVGEAAEDAVD